MIPKTYRCNAIVKIGSDVVPILFDVPPNLYAKIMQQTQVSIETVTELPEADLSLAKKSKYRSIDDE